MRFRKQATLLLLGALTLLTLGLATVSAAPVTFSANTAGTFGIGNSGGSVGGGGSTLTIGNTTITFSSKPSEVNVTLEPGQTSNITLGVFNATSTGSNAINAATFTLTINFTLPNDTSGQTVSATVSGTISSGASGASVNWSTTTLTFNSPTAGTFTLTIEPSTPINSPASPDASRIRGTITYNGAAAIPEPLTLLTLGSGLAGLAALSRRRREK